jgi:hypothetical protein
MWSDLVTLSYPRAKQESESKFPLPTQTKTSIEPLMLLLELGRSLKLFPKCIVLCVLNVQSVIYLHHAISFLFFLCYHNIIELILLNWYKTGDLYFEIK